MSRSVCRVLTTVFALLGGLVLAGGSATAQLQKRVALVIGNADYRHVAILPNADSDADALADSLGRLGFDVKRLLNADLPAMRAAVEELQRAAPDADAALLFFAGHSLRQRGAARLVPVDAGLQDGASVERDTLALEPVMNALAKARNAFLLVDGCVDSRLAERLQWAGGVQPGLGQPVARPGLVAAVASTQERACTGRPFVDSLLVQIEEPGLDAGRLFGLTQQLTVHRSGGAQVLAVAGSLGGPFVFAREDLAVPAFRQLGIDPGIEAMRGHVGKYGADTLTPVVKAALGEKEALQARSAGRETVRLWNGWLDESWNRTRLEKARTSRNEALEARWSREAEAARQGPKDLRLAVLTPPAMPLAASAPPAASRPPEPRDTRPAAEPKPAAPPDPKAAAPARPPVATAPPKPMPADPKVMAPTPAPADPKAAIPTSPPASLEPKPPAPEPRPAAPEPKAAAIAPPPLLLPSPPPLASKPAVPDPKVVTPVGPLALPEPKPAAPEPKIAAPSPVPEPKVAAPVPAPGPKLEEAVPSPDQKIANLTPPVVPPSSLPAPVPESRAVDRPDQPAPPKPDEPARPRSEPLQATPPGPPPVATPTPNTASLPPPAVAPPSTFNPDSLESVRAAQQELKRVGCYAGEVDGVTGPQTKNALGVAAGKLGPGSGVQPLTEKGLSALRDHKGVLCPPPPAVARAVPVPQPAAPAPAPVVQAPAAAPPPPAPVVQTPPPAPTPPDKKNIRLSM